MIITKFIDIPQFFGTASCFHTNYGLKDYVQQIKEYEINNTYNLQMTPNFQRGHIWTEAQQISYIEYLLKGGKSGRQFFFNFPSWFSQKTLEYNDFVCVDGLQRTTALQRFFNNEIQVYGSFFKDYEDEPRSVIQQLDIYINDLQSEKEVLEWYIQMNSGGTPHTKEEINKVVQLLNALK